MLDRFERFSFGISEVSKHWHKLSAEEMERHGLRSTHAVYLLTMAKYPEGLTAPQLCELCGRDKSDVSRMMRIMEKQGLATKESAHQRRYKGVFRLTQEGLATAHQVQQRAALAVEFAGKDLSNENRAIFYEALASIAENLRQLCRDGLPENED